MRICNDLWSFNRRIARLHFFSAPCEIRTRTYFFFSFFLFLLHAFCCLFSCLTFVITYREDSESVRYNDRWIWRPPEMPDEYVFVGTKFNYLNITYGYALQYKCFPISISQSNDITIKGKINIYKERRKKRKIKK